MIGPVEFTQIQEHGSVTTINYAEENGKVGYLQGDHSPIDNILTIWHALGCPRVWIDFEDEDGPTVHFISPDGVGPDVD